MCVCREGGGGEVKQQGLKKEKEKKRKGKQVVLVTYKFAPTPPLSSSPPNLICPVHMIGR